MPDMLHEYWENEDGGSFGPVRESHDLQRPALFPDAKFVFGLHAPSWYRAIQLYQERLGYGDYVPEPGWPDHFYTDEEVSEQDAYLLIRYGS